MENYIVSGDTVTFLPPFGKCIVTPIPGTIPGSAMKTTVTAKPVCLEGDEKKVIVPGVAYVSPPFVTPGVGILMIESLAPDQLSKKTTIEGKAPILKGIMFNAKFQVNVPAMMPTPAGPVPDPVPLYSGGKGMFVPSNMTVNDLG